MVLVYDSCPHDGVLTVVELRKGKGDMEFLEYQRKLLALERERGWDRVLPSHTFLHMGEELGEIGRILQCLEGYRETELGREALCDELAGELADLAAFIFKLANQHDIDMDETMHNHLEKFISRHRDIEEGHREMARYVAHQERNLEWIKGEGKPCDKSEAE